VSGEELKFAVVAFSAVFFVVDPFVAVPFFMAITADDPAEKRRKMALRASVAAFITLTLFALAGGLIFQAFGVSLGAFKIAGGLMLFLMALDMMRAQPSRTRSTSEEQEEGIAREDVAIVPMAIPMLAGPGSIATVMMLMSRAAWQVVPTAAVFVAIAVTCLISWLLLRSAAAAERFLSKTALHVAQRVMGLLLAAVAVEFVVGGVRDLLPTLGG
jgi:multiple antibiotic resistance protein